jgi:hypothetical protein
MKEKYISVFSEPDALRNIANRLIDERYSNAASVQEWGDRLNQGQVINFVPSKTLHEAIEFSNSGGSLIWLGSSLRKKPNRLLRPILSIHGVNSVSICRHAIFYALEFIIECRNSHSSTLILLPSFMRSKSHSPVGDEILPSSFGV